MTLGQLATAVGATRRWVLNALARLRLPHRYDEALARRLALARMLHAHTGIPLARSYTLAGEALAGDPHGSFERTSDDGSVTVRVDLPRFFTNYGARLALALSNYGERLRGRRPKRRRSAIERAKEYGIDVTLLDSALRRTPEERLKRVAEDMEAFSRWRGTAGR